MHPVDRMGGADKTSTQNFQWMGKDFQHHQYKDITMSDVNEVIKSQLDKLEQGALGSDDLNKIEQELHNIHIIIQAKKGDYDKSHWLMKFFSGETGYEAEDHLNLLEDKLLEKELALIDISPVDHEHLKKLEKEGTWTPEKRGLANFLIGKHLAKSNPEIAQRNYSKAFESLDKLIRDDHKKLLKLPEDELHHILDIYLESAHQIGIHDFEDSDLEIQLAQISVTERDKAMLEKLGRGEWTPEKRGAAYFLLGKNQLANGHHEIARQNFLKAFRNIDQVIEKDHERLVKKTDDEQHYIYDMYFDTAFNIGKCYDEHGYDVDRLEAMQWYQIAAEQEASHIKDEAQSALEQMHRDFS